MKTVIEHFYWVPSANNAPGVPAWHVQLIDIAQSEDDVAALGGEVRRGRMLDMAAAAAEGFDIAAIAETINAASLAAVETLKADAAAKGVEIAERSLVQAQQTAALGQVEADLEAARFRLGKAMSEGMDARVEVDKLTKERDGLTTQIERVKAELTLARQAAAEAQVAAAVRIDELAKQVAALEASAAEAAESAAKIEALTHQLAALGAGEGEGVEASADDASAATAPAAKTETVTEG